MTDRAELDEAVLRLLKAGTHDIVKIGSVPPWMEFAGCYDEPTAVTVKYEDEWRSDAARPLYKLRSGEKG